MVQLRLPDQMGLPAHQKSSAYPQNPAWQGEKEGGGKEGPAHGATWARGRCWAARRKGRKERKDAWAGPCGREKRAGWAGPQGGKERGKRKREVGRAQLENEREKQMHSNAYEFELKFKFKWKTINKIMQRSMKWTKPIFPYISFYGFVKLLLIHGKYSKNQNEEIKPYGS
jgi:hypothetical protein